jgi:hypothetical protein
MITEVDRHKADSRLDQTSCEQRLLAPQMIAVSLAHLRSFMRQIESLLSAATDQHVNSLLLVIVHGRDRSRMIHVAAQAVEILQQRASLLNSRGGCVERLLNSRPRGTMGVSV